MFLASYSATKLNIPYAPNTAGVTDFTGGGGLTVILSSYDPNAEIFATNETWEWLGRLTGAYIFPWDVQLSANFEHRSGDPWARQVSFTGGQTIPQIRLRVEEIGTRRLPNLNILNLRVQKSFFLRSGHKLGLQANIYNALNINEPLGVTPLSGPNFNIPTSITPPRVGEVGLTYTHKLFTPACGRGAPRAARSRARRSPGARARTPRGCAPDRRGDTRSWPSGRTSAGCRRPTDRQAS